MNLSGFHKHIVKRYHPFIKNVRNKNKQTIITHGGFLQEFS